MKTWCGKIVYGDGRLLINKVKGRVVGILISTWKKLI